MPNIIIEEVADPKVIKKLAKHALYREGIDVEKYDEHDLRVIVMAIRSYLNPIYGNKDII